MIECRVLNSIRGVNVGFDQGLYMIGERVGMDELIKVVVGGGGVGDGRIGIFFVALWRHLLNHLSMYNTKNGILNGTACC